MKRREFIGSMLSFAPAVTLLNSSSNDPIAAEIDQQLDTIIIGGSLAGCLTACKLARQGSRVLLIEPRTYLGHEITATYRPWIQKESIKNLPPNIKEILFDHDDTAMQGEDDEIPLSIGAIKKNLLHLLRDTGVRVLFMSQIAGTITEKNQIRGVVVGNKSGLQAILSKTVIDMTENCIVARLSALHVKTRPIETASRVVEFKTVGPLLKKTIPAPAELGLHENRVIIHPGKNGPDHKYIEFQFPIHNDPFDSPDRMKWEIEAREKSIRLCSYLKQADPAFQKAVLLQTSSEVTIPLHCKIDEINSDTHEIQSRKNLFVYNAQTILPEEINNDYYYQLSNRTNKLVNSIQSANSETKPNETIDTCAFHAGKLQIPFQTLDPIKQYDHRFEIHFYSITPPPTHFLPEIDECNVLVVGGGTAGASATIAASRSIDNVILVEPLSGLGGTGTLGGINRYYHGYHGGFTKELDEKVKAMTERLSEVFRIADWNVEAKMMTLFEEITNKGGKILFHTRAVATIMKGNEVNGVIVTTPHDGIGVIRAKVTIDATGDGDLAAWSGAETFLGNPRGGNVQTFNQCDWRIRDQVNGVNLDLGVIDNTNQHDVVRGLFIGHKNGSLYDFSPYPSVRESRHVIGDYQLNEPDVFLRQRFPDVIAIGKTDYDQHGLQNSLYACLGYIPYHRDEKIVRIPYRVCLPKGLEQLLVIGKAFSATSDAFCFMRMQADLQNMGYAIGLIAAQAAQKDAPLRKIDLETIQEKLLEKEIIRADDIGTKTDYPSLQDQIEKLKSGDEDALLRVICFPKEQTLPVLEEKYPTLNSDAQLYFAMALARFGSKTGVKRLLEELDVLKDKPQQSEIDSAKRPRGGFLGTPSTYWRVNQLIVLLGLTGDQQAVPLLCQIARQTTAGGPQQENHRLHWRRIPNYDRIISLCFSLERLSDKQAISALDALLKRQYISGYAAKEGIDGEQKFSSAYLEVVIARTLARCGSKTGMLLLADYTEDIRSVLAEHALEELHEITSQNFGHDSRQWQNWIRQNPNHS